MLFDLLNVVFISANLVAGSQYAAEASYKYPKESEAVVEIKAYREWWREDGKGKCQYTGLMVPFVRDWTMVVKENDGMERELPPDLETRAGHAIIYNQKICKDRPAEAVFRMGSTNARNFFNQLPEGGPVFISDFYDMKPEQIPQWLKQVTERIERVAAKDAAAQQFITVSAKDLENVKAAIAAAAPAAAVEAAAAPAPAPSKE